MTVALGKISFSDTPDVNGDNVQVSADIVTALTNTVITGTSGFVMPVGTTAQRPGTPVTGLERFNSTFGAPEVYNGTFWMPHGRVLQMITGVIGVNTGTNSGVPATGTPPLNTGTAAGIQVFTKSFTPVSATSRIVILFAITAAAGTAARQLILSCFAGATNIGTQLAYCSVANAGFPLSMVVLHTPGSTATITYTAYMACLTSGTTMFVNEVTAAINYGGATQSDYIIMELA